MNSSSSLVNETTFPYAHWMNQIAELHARYENAEPFPHIILDDFIRPDMAEKALCEFPTLKSGKWTYYVHVNEKKFGKMDFHSFGPALQALVTEFHSAEFIQFLTALTGIQDIMPDPSLEGGGLHQSGPGGYLNVHADFTVHPIKRNWRRRINLILYLNKNWKDAYGGHLELWDRQMKRRVHRVSPIFNRAVIFNTDPDSFHGFPDPIKCLPGMSRKSVALYYFTQEKSVTVRSTEYRSRPGDGLKRFLIFLDKWVLRIYDQLKRRDVWGDRFASRLLKKVHHFQKRQEVIRKAKRIKSLTEKTSE